MGIAVCRFYEDKGCKWMGSQEWHVRLLDIGRSITVPSMWKHYITEHLIQPNTEEREAIMRADPTKANGILLTVPWAVATGSIVRLPELKILYVERTKPNQYTHKIGAQPDTEFIEKLERILSGIQPWQTKSSVSASGYSA